MTTLHRVGGQLSDVLRGRRLELPGADPGAHAPARYQTDIADTGTNTKGAWTEFIAATTEHYYGLHIIPDNFEVNDRDFLIDIGVGAAGSEQVLVANLYQSVTGSNTYHWEAFHVPIFIPKGTRVALREQANVNLINATWCIYPLNVPIFSPIMRTCETWGANTADSGGTQVDPGAAANTKGAYSQLIASTAKRTRMILVRFGNLTNAARTEYGWQVDLAVGGAGSEVVFLNDIRLFNSGLYNNFSPDHYGPLPVDIPAGSRISARAQCTGTDATDRLVDVIAHGFSQ